MQMEVIGLRESKSDPILLSQGRDQSPDRNKTKMFP